MPSVASASADSPAAVNQPSRQPSRWSGLLLILLALLPRLAPVPFLTNDEAYHWYDRVAVFAQALAERQYAATNLIGHPGVTTLWLGTIGLWIEQLFFPAADPALHRMLLRLPLALVAALCILLAWRPLTKLLGERIATLGLIFWAGEPFLVAHAQLLHLDSLLTSFMTLSLIYALDAVSSPSAPMQTLMLRSWLISALAAGLALLTKSPSLALIPSVGGVLLIAFVCKPDPWPHLGRFLVRRMLPFMLLWIGVAACTWVLLWPAAWVDLGGAVGRVFLQAQADGGSPHGWGNFFFGHAISDPGPLFYPVAIALRLSAWVFAGLLLALLLALGVVRQYWGAWGRLLGIVRSPRRFVLLVLVGYLLGFTLLMSIPPKKFDRYVLPIFPTLALLAAAGWVALAERLAPLAGWRARVFGVASLEWRCLGVVALLAANLAWLHPYALAGFNPLLGGGPVAAQIIPIGWGEGHEQVGAYLATQPNGADRPAAVFSEPVLSPFAPGGAAPMDWAYQPGKVDYAVLYIDQIQRGFKPWLVDGLRGRVEPVATIRIHGIDYAMIYPIAPVVANPRPATFGAGMHLLGYDLDTTQIRASGVITLSLVWQSRGPADQDYSMFVHVLNAAGQRVGQADVPPGGPRWPTSQWGAGHYITSVQQVPLPADTPPGTYRIAIGIYDAATFARQPLSSDPAAVEPAAGNDALRVATFELP
jgi:4-amino-4-deoxy-L-arabinose transferase-like glycosyltransferase